jgi:hypothetical protein
MGGRPAFFAGVGATAGAGAAATALLAAAWAGGLGGGGAPSPQPATHNKIAKARPRRADTPAAVAGRLPRRMMHVLRRPSGSERKREMAIRLADIGEAPYLNIGKNIATAAVPQEHTDQEFVNVMTLRDLLTDLNTPTSKLV